MRTSFFDYEGSMNFHPPILPHTAHPYYTLLWITDAVGGVMGLQTQKSDNFV